MNYTLSSKFYFNSIEKSTMYSSEIIFDQSLKPTQKCLKLNELIRIKICKNVEKYLMSDKNNFNGSNCMTQEESILINKCTNDVWEAVVDWNNFRKHVPSIADSVIYHGEPNTIDSIMHVQIKKSEYQLKVKNVKNSSTEESKIKPFLNNKEYTLEYLEGNSKSPKQDLKFVFQNINENTCQLKFIHSFKEDLNKDLLKRFSKDKKIILNQLKKSLEGGN